MESRLSATYGRFVILFVIIGLATAKNTPDVPDVPDIKEHRTQDEIDEPVKRSLIYGNGVQPPLIDGDTGAISNAEAVNAAEAVNTADAVSTAETATTKDSSSVSSSASSSSSATVLQNIVEPTPPDMIANRMQAFGAPGIDDFYGLRSSSGQYYYGGPEKGSELYGNSMGGADVFPPGGINYGQMSPMQPMPFFYNEVPQNYGYHNNIISTLFQPMMEPSYPAEIQQSADKVYRYLTNSNLNINMLLQNLQNFRHLDLEDQIVGFLLLVQRDLPLDCSVKSDVSSLIMYIMMRNYLSRIPELQNMFPNTKFGINRSASKNAVEYREIIKYLLGKLRCCQKRKAGEVKTEIKYIEKPAPPPVIQIRYLEAPTPAPEVITKIEYVEKPCPTIPTTQAPTEPPYAVLIPAIPAPSNTFEKSKYTTLIAFLGRPDLPDLMGQMDLSSAASTEDKLKMFLNKAASLELEQPVIDAIKYYLNSTRKMGALNLYTQKEFRKQFDLTGIFTVTFDFENLSVEGKLAFEAFYTFLLDITGEQMTNFNTWTEVKTKGEFMHELFSYFLQQEFTSDNVKSAIRFLTPFILMDGEAATPP